LQEFCDLRLKEKLKKLDRFEAHDSAFGRSYPETKPNFGSAQKKFGLGVVSRGMLRSPCRRSQMAYVYRGPQCQVRNWFAESLDSGTMALTTHSVPGPLRRPEPARSKQEWSRVIEAPRFVEYMPYRGESAEDRTAFARYLKDAERGKSLLVLIAMRDALSPEIRKCWYPGTFTAVETTRGVFDELTCNLAYHFGKHGGKHETIAEMTSAATRYFAKHRREAVVRDGKLKFPNGSIFMPDGRIVTFFD
jgi:hypothetical protein